jgi:hypothetical protein
MKFTGWIGAIALTVVGAQTEIAVPQGQALVCTDSPDNRCVAPASCEGMSGTFTAGGGSIAYMNGVTTLSGGGTMVFPADCAVVCRGDCALAASTVTAPPPPAPAPTGTEGSAPTTAPASVPTAASSALEGQQKGQSSSPTTLQTTSAAAAALVSFGLYFV